MIRKEPIATGEIYHVCNRTVDGLKIFKQKRIADRFLATIYVSNNIESRHPCRSFNDTTDNILCRTTPGVVSPLIDILAIVLMPDHFHLLVRQLVDGGISRFIQRQCNSIGKYFNINNKRKGHVFMGPFKAIRLVSDAQAEHIFTYIHANPLDLVEPKWREGGVKDWENGKKFLENYDLSSLGVYTEDDTRIHPLIPGLIDKEFATSYFKSKKDHLNAILGWASRNSKLGDHLVDNDFLE
jgi:putative transposase